MYSFNGLVLCLTAIVVAASKPYSFISIGDWGAAAIDDGLKKNVYNVAKEMTLVASSLDAKFVINTGDNFYWCGIQNTSDFQINVDFVEPYNTPPLDVTWYSSLGNHEYGYNVSAQIEYSKLNGKWYLPDRNYTTRFPLPNGEFMTLLVIDTSPCVSDYRESNQKYWDPCSTKYPTCSLESTNDDFEGPCEFHENILGQNCSSQFEWLKSTLASIPMDDWLVVVGHHPIQQVDVEDFATVLQNRGFSLYLNGHSHTLAQYLVDGKGAYVTTGAGAMIATVDQSHPITSIMVEGGNITARQWREFRESKLPFIHGKSASSPTLKSHPYTTIFNNKTAGFTTHTFSEDFSSLTTNFVSYTGEILRSFAVNKAGIIIN